jgi:hypothetical protein
MKRFASVQIYTTLPYYAVLVHSHFKYCTAKAKYHATMKRNIVGSTGTNVSFV